MAVGEAAEPSGRRLAGLLANMRSQVYAGQRAVRTLSVDFRRHRRQLCRAARTYSGQRHRKMNHMAVFPQLKGIIKRQSVNTVKPSACVYRHPPLATADPRQLQAGDGAPVNVALDPTLADYPDYSWQSCYASRLARACCYGQTPDDPEEVVACYDYLDFDDEEDGDYEDERRGLWRLRRRGFRTGLRDSRPC